MTVRAQAFIPVIAVLYCLAGCDLSKDPSGQGLRDTTPRITVPAEGTELLAGDTISLAWAGDFADPDFWYNFNDSMGMLTSPLWVRFPDSSILELESGKARIVLPLERNSISNNFRVKIEDISDSSLTLISDRLEIDHIILTHPSGGEKFIEGDTVFVTWRSNEEMDRVMVGVTADEKQSPVMIADSSANYPVKHYLWVIGNEVEDMNYPSGNCTIYVKKYDGATWNGMVGYKGLLADFNVVPFEVAGETG
ncbi:MAG: hypothetical protein GF350_13115 [Chitinivibrionales bacterium]|nr:hypothetical protein [Chitinivibrionales bacterium]